MKSDEIRGEIGYGEMKSYHGQWQGPRHGVGGRGGSAPRPHALEGYWSDTRLVRERRLLRDTRDAMLRPSGSTLRVCGSMAVAERAAPQKEMQHEDRPAAGAGVPA